MTLIPIAGKTTRVPAAGDLIPLSPDGNSRAEDVARLGGSNDLNIGSIQAWGHSYIAGANFANTGTDYMEEVGMLGILAGMLKVSNENIIHHGIAGSQLASPTSAFATVLGGWGGVLQLGGPNNATHMTSNAAVKAPVPRSQPGLALLVHGVNDLAADFAGWNLTTQDGRNAYKHALRSVLSRIRAGCLWCSRSPAGTMTWDAIFAFSAGWSTNNPGINNTAAGTRSCGANGETVTITLPLDIIPGTYAVTFIGQQNARTTVGGAGLTNVATSWTPTAFADFPSSGTFVAEILAEGANTREEVLITAGAGTGTWTITRGVNGTAASAHAAAAVVRVASDTFKVNWSTSGANASITGSTQLSGQGWHGQKVAVTKRFVLTAADAGKTIVATSAGYVAGDSAKLEFDSFAMEAPDPTPIVVTLIPRYAWGVAISLNDNATMNADMATIVAEFDADVQLADIDSDIWNRGGVANGATGTTSPVAFTANNKTVFDTLMNAVPFKPFRMTIGGIEDIWVTGITFVSGSNYSLTCIRGYNGTAATSLGSTTWMSWAELMADDNVHPNAYGHAYWSDKVMTAIKALQLSSIQLARCAGNWTQNAKVPMIDCDDNNYVLPNTIGTILSQTIATGRVTYVPVWIPKECTLTEIGCRVTTLNAGSTIALGIYDLDFSNQRPGSKLYDCGTISGGSTGLRTISALCLRHRGGWVYLAFLQTGASATVNALPVDGLAHPFLPQSSTALAAGPGKVNGYVGAGGASVLPASGGAVEVIGAQTTTNVVAWMYARSRATRFI